MCVSNCHIFGEDNTLSDQGTTTYGVHVLESEMNCHGDVAVVLVKLTRKLQFFELSYILVHIF